MKRTKILSVVFCLSLMATGCLKDQKTTDTGESSEQVSKVTSEASDTAHEATVEVITTLSIPAGDNYEYTSVVPKLIVDGEEATEINDALGAHIQEKYPMEEYDGYAEGFSTSIEWGVTEDTVSIVIHASDTSSDYFTCEAFNYDLDTLKELDDSEVTARLGMSDDELFGKVETIITQYCDDHPSYDLEASLAAINYDKITPFISSNGNAAVVVCIVYADDSQFAGSESMRTIDIIDMTIRE